MFALYWDESTKTLKGINGSGRSPEKLDMDTVRKDGINGREMWGSSIPRDTLSLTCHLPFSISPLLSVHA